MSLCASQYGDHQLLGEVDPFQVLHIATISDGFYRCPGRITLIANRTPRYMAGESLFRCWLWARHRASVLSSMSGYCRWARIFHRLPGALIAVVGLRGRGVYRGQIDGVDQCGERARLNLVAREEQFVADEGENACSHQIGNYGGA